MRNVTRLECPNSLIKHGKQWARELLRDSKNCKKTGSQIPNKHYRRYKSDDITSRLSEMYEGLCCYCEGDPGITGYGEVEHKFPKSIFPQYWYEWENLHWSCRRCNGSKGDQYDPKHRVLDAAKDNPITRHLHYDRVEVLSLVCRYRTRRGEVTINFTDLNRERLCWARDIIYERTFDIIRDIRNNPISPHNELKKGELKRMTTGPFGSVVIWCCNRQGYSLEPN